MGSFLFSKITIHFPMTSLFGMSCEEPPNRIASREMGLVFQRRPLVGSADNRQHLHLTADGAVGVVCCDDIAVGAGQSLSCARAPIRLCPERRGIRHGLYPHGR